MKLLLKLVIEILAVKRITRLIVDDHLLEPARQKLWEVSPPEKIGVGFIATCHACASIWAGIAVRSGLLPPVLRDTLALSEAALLIKNALPDED